MAPIIGNLDDQLSEPVNRKPSQGAFMAWTSTQYTEGGGLNLVGSRSASTGKERGKPEQAQSLWLH